MKTAVIIACVAALLVVALCIVHPVDRSQQIIDECGAIYPDHESDAFAMCRIRKLAGDIGDR